MHRLTLRTALWSSALLLTAATFAACGGKQAANPSEKTGDGKDDRAFENGPEDDAGAEKPRTVRSDACLASDSANLEDLLAKVDCEVPDIKPDAVPTSDLKGKLEVAVTASPTKAKPGSKADLLVTFSNKTKEPLPLNFRLDPLARFETEAYDAKAKRVDMPAGTPPPAPKGHTAPPPAEQKLGRIMLPAGGSVRVHVPWDAVKMKWAPEKVRGTAVEKGYPRSPAGPLPKGKYSVKVITPLVGVSEGGEHEVSAPRVDIEVGG